MAYNPYLPYPYQPQNIYQPLQQQPQQQPSGILWVSSELEAQSYPVAPNNAVALWDSTKPAVYLKQADASGKPTMRVYTLAERSETPQAPPEPGKEYALKTDLEAVVSAIVALKKDVKTLKKDIAKKEEDEDDE